MKRKKLRRPAFYFVVAVLLALNGGALWFYANPQVCLNRQLVTAVRSGEFADVQAALQASADPNIKVRNGKLVLFGYGSGEPLVGIANNPTILLELLTRGAQVNLDEDTGRRLWSLAIDGNSDTLLEALLQSNGGAGHLLNPMLFRESLWEAIRLDSHKVIEYFVTQKGVDLNLPSGPRGPRQPLYLIQAVFTNPSCIPLLLQLGADPNQKDQNGKTALDYARMMLPTETRPQAIAALTAKTAAAPRKQ